MYVLRSFLQFNSRFSVQLMSTYLAHFHADVLSALMPLCMKNVGGDIWLRKE